MIFTADVDADGNITPNNQMYSQTTETLNLSSNAARTVQISVPENGGYYIMMIVSSDTCSDCCHGSLNLQCGIETSTSGNTTLCEAGNPSVIYMQGFSEQTRPAYNFDFYVSISDLMPWGCDCVCDVEC